MVILNMLEKFIPEDATTDVKVNRIGKSLLVIFSTLVLVLEYLTTVDVIPEEFRVYIPIVMILLYGFIDLLQKYLEPEKVG